MHVLDDPPPRDPKLVVTGVTAKYAPWPDDPNFILYDVVIKVGRCWLTVSKPVLRAPMVSALDTIIS